MTNDTTMMDQALAEQREEYETVIAKIGTPDGKTTFADHPGAKYLSTGFGQGFINGYKTSAGASHAGLSVIIGAIDAGLVDLDTVKEQAIQLRDAIKQEAGL